jgi:hypothetical protein
VTATSTASAVDLEDVQPRSASPDPTIDTPAFTRADLLIALLLGAAVLVVHDVGYMMRHAFWVDEAWVADSVRTPVGQFPALTSSTPLGWTTLLRLIPGTGEQRLRLLPLAFTVLATMTAYLLGRELRLGRYRSACSSGRRSCYLRPC